jgi:hypothetical protein
MNPKVMLGLFLSTNVGLLLPIAIQSATAAVLSDQPTATRQSSVEVDVVDLDRRESSELLLAENTSSNDSSNSSSNTSSNESSNTSSNDSSNSSSNESSNTSSDSDGD